jgi:hypothetical protein
MRTLSLALVPVLLFALGCTCGGTESPTPPPPAPEAVDTAQTADAVADVGTDTSVVVEGEESAEGEQAGPVEGEDGVTEAPGSDAKPNEKPTLTPEQRKKRRRRMMMMKKRRAAAKGAAPAADEGAAQPDAAPDATEPPAEEAAAAPKATPKPVSHDPSPKPPGIKQVGTRSWTVTKTLFQRWKENPYRLGHIDEAGAGWKVTQVRQKPTYHLGIRGKDVVMSVNGRKLDTNAQLMSAYLALQLKKKFDVEFKRQGKTITHHYEVVSD